jgi:type IV pilus assembly protein PilV
MAKSIPTEKIRAVPDIGNPAMGAGLRLGNGGFTLIEVLIALVLFSIGVLGIVALQGNAVNFTTQSENSTRAALLANEAATMMQLQQSLTLSSADSTTWTNLRTDSTSNLYLPASTATVIQDASGDFATIQITWTDASQKSTSSSRSHTYRMVVTKPN